MNKICRVVFRRRVFVILILLIQIGFPIFLLLGLDSYAWYAPIVLSAVSIGVCVHVVNRQAKAAYKITWIFLILLFPIFGGIMYIIFHSQSTSRRFKRQTDRVAAESRDAFFIGGDCQAQFALERPEFEPQSRFLRDRGGFPVFAGTQAEYLPSGEGFHARLLEELEKARRYIFLEFFIIREGTMFGSILSILERKAREGLDVRLIYDDLGCFFTLPADFRATMEAKGIKCLVFNPFRPVLSSLQNHRNHRKIVAIDGMVAFTGGANIGDEYINAVERFGNWKDAAIMLEGAGAWSFALIFLQMWNASAGAGRRRGRRADGFDYGAFHPQAWLPQEERQTASGALTGGTRGYVQPYADSPIDKEHLCENVYLHLIGRARKYVYINTPYLILDDGLLSALTLAAKSGVDVRIITPHRWDKWIVAVASRSYYRQLILAGVKVYEYSRGFNHGKTFVCDDAVATVGTANLDFRSLYLHFECGVVVYGGDAVRDIRDDFMRTVPVSREIAPGECSRNLLHRALSDVLRIFAPLM